MSRLEGELVDSDQARALSCRSARRLKIALVVAIVVALNAGGTWLIQQFGFPIFPRHEPLLHFIVLGTALLYIVLMAIPFMPGIEIGLMLMLMLGSKGALLVYLCTLVALSISFTIGRVIPAHLVYRDLPVGVLDGQDQFQLKHLAENG